MKQLFLPILLVASSFQLQAQTKTYAFSSNNVGSYDWNALREINVVEGKFENDVYTKNYNIPQQVTRIKSSSSQRANFGFSHEETVAAAAYDKVHNRLYFANMFSPDLKYVDLNNSKEVSIKIITDDKFSLEPKVGEHNVFTRMCFDNKGFGYAITNDGKNMVRFTTDEKNTITNLGSLKDSYKNTSISVHTQCTSWGGDIVGDVYGNLYLVTLRSHVFRINTSSLEAEYIGQIKNLPADYTTNGVAADEDGNLILASANNSKNIYKVNPATWEATAITIKGNAYNVSDLANENLVYQSRVITTKVAETKLVGLKVYPNPIVNKNVQLNFTEALKGTYSVFLTTIEGKTINTTKFQLNGETNRNLQLSKSVTTGAYTLRVVDANGKSLYNNTIIIQ